MEEAAKVRTGGHLGQQKAVFRGKGTVQVMAKYTKQDIIEMVEDEDVEFIRL